MHSTPTRRHLLQRGLACTAAAATTGLLRSHAWATTAVQADALLLVVLLRGGYDGYSLLAPVWDEHYQRARPHTALQPPAPTAAHGAATGASAVSLGVPGWALHPAAAPHLWPLWQRGELAFIPHVGPRTANRSHFDAQHQLETGLPDPSLWPRDAQQRSRWSGLRGTGWLHRLAQRLGATAPPISFTDGTPTIFAGASAVPELSLRAHSARPPFDERQTALLAALHDAHPQAAADLAQAIALRALAQQQLEALQQRAKAAGQALPGGFELEARRMAQLMRHGWRLGFVDLQGWDTHVHQGAHQGPLAQQLRHLSAGIAALADELGPPLWARTTVLVMSEFGRTLQENGQRGTDHGHGNVWWLAGGALAAQGVLGDHAHESGLRTAQQRDWPAWNEPLALRDRLVSHLYGLQIDA